jgi:hypothetical protein
MYGYLQVSDSRTCRSNAHLELDQRGSRRVKCSPSQSGHAYLCVVSGCRQGSAKLVKPGLLNPLFLPFLRFAVSNLARHRPVIVVARRRAPCTTPQQLIRAAAAAIHGRAQDRSRGIFADERLTPRDGPRAVQDRRRTGQD